MAHIADSARFARGSLLLFAACIAGCAASAKNQKPPEDPVAARAEIVKKLNPAEIMQAGDDAASRGEYDRAVTMYNQAIEAQPSADLWFRVGWIYSQLGKKSIAAQAFAHALEYDPNHAGANEALGLLYLEGKQHDSAVAHLQRAVNADGKRWHAHNALGVLADAAHDYPTAIAHYQAALAVQPGSAMLLNNIGYSNYLAGHLDEAAQWYEKVLAAQPDYRPALLNKGLLLARQGHYDAAMDVMNREMEPAQAHNDVGYIAYQNGDLDVAERLLTEAIGLSPSYYETAQQNLARVRGAQMAKAAKAAPVASR